MYMDLLEQHTIASASRLRIWHMDDVLEIIKKGQVDNITQHLNQADVTGSI